MYNIKHTMVLLCSKKLSGQSSRLNFIKKDILIKKLKLGASVYDFLHVKYNAVISNESVNISFCYLDLL